MQTMVDKDDVLKTLDRRSRLTNQNARLCRIHPSHLADRASHEAVCSESAPAGVEPRMQWRRVSPERFPERPSSSFLHSFRSSFFKALGSKASGFAQPAVCVVEGALESVAILGLA